MLGKAIPVLACKGQGPGQGLIQVPFQSKDQDASKLKKTSDETAYSHVGIVSCTTLIPWPAHDGAKYISCRFLSAAFGDLCTLQVYSTAFMEDNCQLMVEATNPR